MLYLGTNKHYAHRPTSHTKFSRNISSANPLRPTPGLNLGPLFLSHPDGWLNPIPRWIPEFQVPKRLSVKPMVYTV